jgi:hypothetical protein
LLFYIYGKIENKIKIFIITDHEIKFNDGLKNYKGTKDGVVVLLFKILRNLGHHKRRRKFLNLLRDY